MTLEKLGAERINNSNITHFNNSNDWLSHIVEAKLSPLAGVQVGTCYVVPKDPSKSSHDPSNIATQLRSAVMRIENEAAAARREAAKAAAARDPRRGALKDAGDKVPADAKAPAAPEPARGSG